VKAYRYFDSKKYILRRTADSRAEANQFRAHLKSKGYKVRVVKRKQTIRGQHRDLMGRLVSKSHYWQYDVYARKPSWIFR